MSAIYLAIIIIILVFLVSKQLNENYNSTALVTLEHPPSGGASSPTLAYGSSSRGASRPTGEPPKELSSLNSYSFQPLAPIYQTPPRAPPTPVGKLYYN